MQFPDLPGCFTEGATREQALQHAQEALSLYLTETRKAAAPIPTARHRKSRAYCWIFPAANVAIALMIRQLRQKHQLSQRQLAQKLGIATQQLQKLETPGKSNPTVKTLDALCRALGQDLRIDLAA